MQFSCNKEQILNKLKEMKIQRKKPVIKEVKKEDLLDENKQPETNE